MMEGGGSQRLKHLDAVTEDTVPSRGETGFSASGPVAVHAWPLKKQLKAKIRNNNSISFI